MSERIGIIEIIDYLVSQIKDDDGLKQYVNDTFGKILQIFVGLNLNNPPGQEFMPYVVVAGIERSSITPKAISYRLLIGIEIYDEKIEESSPVREYCGFKRSEELREKIENVIGNIKGLGRIEIEGETVQNQNFPVWTAGTSFIIEFPNTRRK